MILNNNKNSKLVLKTLLNSDLDFDTNWRNDNQRHYLHAFPAKFPASLPKLFIENLTQSNDLILDPLAGSATTLIEASFLERKSIGFDIDPLSLIISNAKLINYNTEKILNKTNEIIEKAETNYHNNKSDLEQNLKQRFDKETLDFLNYWFPYNTQLELLALINEIEQISDNELQSFLKLVFSGIIVTKSGGITYALDLAHTRPHKVNDKKLNSGFDEFKKKAKQLLPKLETKLHNNAVVKHGNAKSLPIDSNSVDLIVTSPPYANNAIDYMRAHKFSLVWFGYSIAELRKIRKKYIGSENLNGYSLMNMPKVSQNIIKKLSELNQNKGKALHRYYTEMQKVIIEMYRVLKPESAAIIVVATSNLAGIDVITHKCLSEIGIKAGFELIGIGEREINRNRRMLPSSHKKNNSQIENRMHNEFVIGLWKN